MRAAWLVAPTASVSMKSFPLNRLVLALAAGVALFGALLKLTETTPEPPGSGTASGARVAREVAPSDAAHPAGLPAGERPDQLALADDSPGSGAAQADHKPASDAPVVGTFELPGPKIAPVPVPEHVAPTSRRSRGERRTRGGTTGAATAAGVDVASAGASPASGLGGGHASGGTPTAAGQPVAAAANPQNKAQNADTPQLPPDVAYDSGDELLSTGQPREIPDMSKIAGRTGTMSLWLQPQWGEGNHDDAAIVQLGDNLQLVKNVNFLRFELAQDEGTGGIGVPIEDWKAGEWHQVTATWNGNQISLYVDGQLASTATRDSPIDLGPDTNLRIGSNFPTSRPVAPAVIGRVDLRTRTLPASDIATAYARAVDNAAKQATKQ